jgi:hypothetical protein
VAFPSREEFPVSREFCEIRLLQAPNGAHNATPNQIFPKKIPYLRSSGIFLLLQRNFQPQQRNSPTAFGALTS